MIADYPPTTLPAAPRPISLPLPNDHSRLPDLVLYPLVAYTILYRSNARVRPPPLRTPRRQAVSSANSEECRQSAAALMTLGTVQDAIYPIQAASSQHRPLPSPLCESGRYPDPIRPRPHSGLGLPTDCIVPGMLVLSTCLKVPSNAGLWHRRTTLVRRMNPFTNVSLGR